MIPLIKRFFHDLFYSAERATLWFRGIATWFATAAALLVAYPPETIGTWHLKDWGIRFGIAGVAAIAVMKKAGERNDPPAAPPAP